MTLGGITAAEAATWAIAACATAGVVIRPWSVPEAVWALLGAAALVLFSLLPWQDALQAVGKGTDVYLFLVGMMLLAELARAEGLFDWLAAHAAKSARGSPARLFALVYLVGIAVTTFLSNDATAVVLTPAVHAAARAASAKPLPYLVACAMIANAASFVLPISNPANLVLYGNGLPPLLPWIEQFALPSVAAIAATYIVLRWLYRFELKGKIALDIRIPELGFHGRLTAYGICATAIVLLAASAMHLQLGAPTAVAGAITAIAVLYRKGESPLRLLAGVPWGILPLVAGLFVLVEGLDHTGVVGLISELLTRSAAQSPTRTALAGGTALAFATNAMNNLPAGLIAGSAASPLQLPPIVTGALLIGVDLGPNLSVTGSLATILWLLVLKREGETCTSWQFLKIGAAAMPAALVPALAALHLVS